MGKKSLIWTFENSRYLGYNLILKKTEEKEQSSNKEINAHQSFELQDSSCQITALHLWSIS
jgi:hypothetical protein